ncbi:MAG: glycosyltransferase family 1 protein [bacterium]|nr:glycosyltransferase family 1 protein [bacterium]
MKIGIDARMYGPKQGGLGRYVEQLILHLEVADPSFHGDDSGGDSPSASPPCLSGRQAHRRGDNRPDADTNEYVIFLRRDNWDEFTPTNPRFKKVLADVPWYGWREQIILPIIFGRAKVDLMHFPHWNVPILYGGKFIVTIHDLLLLEYPSKKASMLGPMGYWFKSLAYKIVLKNAVGRAEKIITVSEFSKRDIVKKLGVKEEKVAVTYLAPSVILNLPAGRQAKRSAVPARLWREGSPEMAGDSCAFATGFGHTQSASPQNDIWGISRPFILYVGVAYPHKNLERLLRAWKKFCNTYGDEWQLVLAGRKDYFYDKIQDTWKKIQTLTPIQGIAVPAFAGINYADANRLPRNDSVVFTGFVSDDELDNLYKNASLLVMPSLYEGFGLPPLEAMRQGVPVASSNRSSLPEILRNAAIYFDPENETDMVTAIHTALTDDHTRKKLIEAGQKLYPTYSWETTARQTAKIYQSVDK